MVRMQRKHISKINTYLPVITWFLPLTIIATHPSELFHPFQGLGRAVAPIEEDTIGGVVSDEEEEGVVSDEGGWHHGTAQHHDSGRGSGGFCALLVDLHKGFVDDFGQDKVVSGGHACGETDKNRMLSFESSTWESAGV